MKILCWIAFIALNFWLLFIYTKKFERATLLKSFGALIPIIFVAAILIMLAMWLAGLHPDATIKDAFFSTLMALIVIVMINFGNQFFFYMVDAVIGFHQKHNAGNLHRQPVKFLIDNQVTLKRFISIVLFLGSALALYGIWLGKK